MLVVEALKAEAALHLAVAVCADHVKLATRLAREHGVALSTL